MMETQSQTSSTPELSLACLNCPSRNPTCGKIARQLGALTLPDSLKSKTTTYPHFNEKEFN